MYDLQYVTSKELEALRSDIFYSLRVAMPGTVISFDPEKQTANIQPAMTDRRHVKWPMMRDVPVFFPGSRDCAITWPVKAGDECLMIFADMDTDAWQETGEPCRPRSNREHDTSDAFAFVGFRSRPNVLKDFPDKPTLFRHDHNDLYYTKAETDEKLILSPSGGAGQVKPATTRKVSEIATAEEGWSVTSAQYACWGKMAMVQLVVKNTSEAASGISMPCMLPEGKRPLLSAQAQGSGKCDAQITDAGEVLLTGTVAAGASVTVLATYLLP